MPTPPPIGLLGMGAYVPERVMTNDDWSRLVDTTDEWIMSRTGIRERRIASEDTSTVDLALPAARAALADAGIAATDLDEIIVATDTPELLIPDTAAVLQHRLGARRVPSFDLAGSGCAGFVLALDVACARVAWHSGRRGGKVMVLGAELLSRLMDWRDRETCVLFGDAAAAAVIGRLDEEGPADAPRGEIVAVHAGTDGSCESLLRVEVGGTRKPITRARVEARLHRNIEMNGRGVFKEAVTRMSASSRAVLARAGVALEDVDLVIPHQANLRIIDAVGKHLGVPREKVFVNIEDYGNTGSASVPLALVQARDAGRVGRGDCVLLTSFGAGFHWASALLRF